MHMRNMTEATHIALPLLNTREIRMPWHNIKIWNPISIDALGLITLLGAEEVAQAVGSLEKRKFTEYLPLLGAYFIAGERFLERQLGYSLYDIDDGLEIHQLNGWFTRWVTAQKGIEDATTIFRFNLVRKTGRTSAWDWVALVIGLLLVVPLLPCTVLAGDWWGLVNWCAITISIPVRVVLLRYARSVRENYWEDPKGQQKTHSKATDEAVRTLFVHPDGRMLTIYVPKAFLPALSFSAYSERGLRYPPPWYQLASYVGWVAFGLQAVALGMSTLMTQIYTVVLMLVSTWVYVKRFDWDLQSMTEFEADWNGKSDLGDEKCKRVIRPFSNGINVEQVTPGDKDSHRMHAYARLLLTEKEEDRMREWRMMPERAGNVATEQWYQGYQQAKTDYGRWLGRHQDGDSSFEAATSPTSPIDRRSEDNGSKLRGPRKVSTAPI